MDWRDGAPHSLLAHDKEELRHLFGVSGTEDGEGLQQTEGSERRRGGMPSRRLSTSGADESFDSDSGERVETWVGISVTMALIKTQWRASNEVEAGVEFL